MGAAASLATGVTETESKRFTREIVMVKLHETFAAWSEESKVPVVGSTSLDNFFDPSEALLLKLRAQSLSAQFWDHLYRGKPPASSTDSALPISKKGEHNKPKQLEEFLMALVRDDYMFGLLDEEQMSQVVKLLQPQATKPRETMFEQGSKPNRFYAIESGNFSVSVDNSKSRLVGPGQTFGEIALIYDTRRSATVVSTGHGKVWFLNRAKFMAFLPFIRAARKEKINTWCKQQPLFAGSDSEEMCRLCRLMVVHCFPANSIVEAASEPSTVFAVLKGAIVQQGNIRASIPECTDQSGDGSPAVCGIVHKAGAWFEMGRLRNKAIFEPWVSKGETVVLAMGLADLDKLPDMSAVKAVVLTAIGHDKRASSSDYSCKGTEILPSRLSVSKRLVFDTNKEPSKQSPAIRHSVSESVALGQLRRMDSCKDFEELVRVQSELNVRDADTPSPDLCSAVPTRPLLRRRHNVPIKEQKMEEKPAGGLRRLDSKAFLTANTEAVPKSKETHQLLFESLSQHFLFSYLQRSNLDEMVNCMAPVKVSEGAWVYKAGDSMRDNDLFFVIESGTVEVTGKLTRKSLTSMDERCMSPQSMSDTEILEPSLSGSIQLGLLSPKAKPKSRRESKRQNKMSVEQLGRGRNFGDLALMYSIPRPASVQALSETQLWSLDQITFKKFRALGAREQRLKLKSFLAQHKFISMLPDHSRGELADAFVRLNFVAGAVIIRESDEGDVCYFVGAGRVEVTRAGEHLEELGEGDFFGELSLLNEEPRSATVTCIGDVSCFVISRAAFQKLRGNMTSVITKVLNSPSGRRKKCYFDTKVFVPKSVWEPTDTAKAKSSDFVVHLCIGEGSYGQVMLVKHKITNEPYAVKRVPIAAKKKPKGDSKERGSDTSETEADVGCFEPRELRLLKLMNHPFVSCIVTTFQSSVAIFLVMPFYQGGDMFSMLVRSPRKTLSKGDARFYLAEVHMALNHIHGHRVIFRDLKLENIVLDGDGHIKVVDFGLAKQVRAGERTFTICGTPEYMSPEMVRGQGYTTTSDYWAFGVLMHELLVGFPPFGTREGSFETGYYQVHKIVCEYTKKRARVEHMAPEAARKAVQQRCRNIRTKRQQRLLELLPDLATLNARTAIDAIMQLLDPRVPVRLRGRALETHPFFAKRRNSEMSPDKWWAKMRNRKITPPWVPKVDSGFDTQHFDEFNTDSQCSFFT